MTLLIIMLDPILWYTTYALSFLLITFHIIASSNELDIAYTLQTL